MNVPVFQDEYSYEVCCLLYFIFPRSRYVSLTLCYNLPCELYLKCYYRTAKVLSEVLMISDVSCWVKFALQKAMTDKRGSRGIAPLFF